MILTILLHAIALVIIISITYLVNHISHKKRMKLIQDAHEVRMKEIRIGYQSIYPKGDGFRSTLDNKMPHLLTSVERVSPSRLMYGRDNYNAYNPFHYQYKYDNNEYLWLLVHDGNGSIRPVINLSNLVRDQLIAYNKQQIIMKSGMPPL
jgi:hypothetical protein